MKKKEFTPGWTNTPPKPGTYRSIFKWGAPDGFKHPNQRLYDYLKETFSMTDADFKTKIREGNETVSWASPAVLSTEHVAALGAIVGEENISSQPYDRIKYATGQTCEEALSLRCGQPSSASDLILHPRHKDDVRQVVSYCSDHKIPLVVYGGGSSVTLGLKSSQGSVTLVMGTHMNRVLSFNESNQTVTVEPGMMGPAYEALLNNAPQTLQAKRRYTGGHFPQSFEYSSVGGWVVTLGSGQASSYYGDMYDMVVSQEFVTPIGDFKTLDYPGTATGPKVNDIMKGSEGAYGVLVAVTLKVFRYMPDNRRRFAFIFPSWDTAVAASKEICQGEFGMPAVFRISDAEETEIGLKLYGVEDTVIDRWISFRGFTSGKRCLCIGTTEGEAGYTRNVKKRIKQISRRHGGMYITGFAVKKWEHGRFQDPYLREDLNDFGIMIDTLEAGVTWENLHRLRQGVRKYIKSRPQTVCMTHASHFYPQGTNLYFIFFAKMDRIE
jgi:alkyldihydroxyacetonephosphate synthase